MKLGYTFAAVVLAAGLVSAQTVEHKSKSKVKVEDGEEVTLTGCVEHSADGSYVLTNAAGKKGASASYVLAATDDDDLDDIDQHVGHILNGRQVKLDGAALPHGHDTIQHQPCRLHVAALGRRQDGLHHIGSVVGKHLV